MIKVEKDTTNGFFAPRFQQYLNENPDLESVTVVGCCTDICVLQFTQSLKTYTQTLDKRLEIKVVKNAVDTFHTPTHDKQVFHDTALELMKNAGILLI
jgi:nicotinamidase-related amidase